MRLYKRANGYWYVEVERAHPKSLKTKEADLARKIFRRMRREIMLGRLSALDSQKTVTLSEFKLEYIRDRRNKKAKKTVDADELALTKLIDTVGNKKLSQLQEKDFDQCVDHWIKIGNIATTVNIHLRHLRSAFNKAVKLDYLQKNPLAGYEFLKEDGPLTRFLKPHDIQELINTMKKHGEDELIAMLRFYLLTGARRNEIFRLEARNIHREEGIIHIRKSKGQRERWIPISPFLNQIIEELNIPQVGRIFTRYRHPDTITHKVKEYLTQAGFKDFRLHDLRHTFASLLAIKGATQKEIKELLGHSDIRTSDRYTHLAMDRLKEVVSNLDFAVKSQSMGKSKVVSGGKGEENKK